MSPREQTIDCIEIHDLLLRCLIGINPEERRDKQDVLINITLWADLGAAAAADDIQKTVNYRNIVKRVIEHVERSEYFLLETLTSRIADLCLEDAQVTRARVKVEKPGALRFARSVGVTLERAH